MGIITEQLLTAVGALARRAGHAILAIYEGATTEVTLKDDDSPLTNADLASQQVILEGLTALTPEIPVLSEESAARPWEERRHWERFWLVDPLDGTKEFVKRNGEFTVNIALVEHGEPVLGVVYAPVLDRGYHAAQGLGAWRREGTDAPQPIEARGPDGGPWVAVASRSHADPRLTQCLERLGSYRVTSMGSSLKLCLVADGAAHLYPRLGPTMEWDTGAAHAVVRAAGGQVLGYDGTPLAYNKQHLRNPRFLVLGRIDVPWREAFAELVAEATSP